MSIDITSQIHFQVMLFFQEGSEGMYRQSLILHFKLDSMVKENTCTCVTINFIVAYKH